jgi:CubicO group peptidase (beta-lactamase class C family)
MKRLAIAVLGTIVALAAWGSLVLYLAFSGFWMKPIAARADQAGFAARAIEKIKNNDPGAVAFAMVRNGKIFEEYYDSPEDTVGSETVFPTASFSKWITALAVMSLVEDGRVDLDSPAALYLKRWQLRDGPFDESKVTVRRLLSHTSGLTDGLGFGDYRADETLPGLLETLNSPRNSQGSITKLEVGAEPGKTFEYSGGGFLILQLLIEDVTGESFEAYIQRTILDPAKMQHSSFRFIGDIPDAAPSLDRGSKPAARFRYAAAGATGFSSSTNDLYALVTAISAKSGDFILKPSSVKAMRSPEASVFGAPIWGLGTILYAPTQSGDFVFGHDGANSPAINSTVRINPDTGDALIILVSGNPSLASDLGADWVLWQTGKPDILASEEAIKSAIVPGSLGALAIVVLIILAMRHRRRSTKS